MNESFQCQIWNDFNDKEPLLFIKEVLYSLNDEINLCLKHYSFTNKRNRIPEDQQMIFWLCTEMSWVSLLSNAMIRRFGLSVCTLREIALHEGEKGYLGRPDLLVSYHSENKKYHFLFEGKMDEWKGTWKPKDEEVAMKEYYESIRSQSVKYVDVLTNEIIDEYNPLLVTIGFEWMRSKSAIESAGSYFKKGEFESQTEFCALYTRDNSGMWVFGKIFGLE